MRKASKSLKFALDGLVHAVREERNIRLFLLWHVIVIALGVAFGIPIAGWILIGFLAGIFLITELLNTAMERIIDAFDDCEKKRNSGHYHPGLKAAKDVAAAASLVALILEIIMLALIAYPFIRLP